MVDLWKTKNRFNLGTQKAFGALIDGYVDRDHGIGEHIQQAMVKYGLQKIMRFDMGQNNDGCAPQVAEHFLKRIQRLNIEQAFKNYPTYLCGPLKKKIADLHDLSESCIILSAGIEQMIGIIANAFLSPNDPVLIPRPTFFLFENFSRRMGAIPLFLDLDSLDDFNWTADTLERFRRMVRKNRPRLIWIANPNNPTGLKMPEYVVRGIIDEATRINSVVVFDEAYGEYTDSLNGVTSTSRFLPDCKNLIVMRTFSKAYGLAGIRVGYAMTGDRDILKALKMHGTNFPFPKMSLEMAECAVGSMDHLELSRNNTKTRRKAFLAALENCPGIVTVRSDCNILMLGHAGLSASELVNSLEKKGIFTSRIPGQGKISDHFIRITLAKPEENQILQSNLASLCGTPEENSAQREALLNKLALENQV